MLSTAHQSNPATGVKLTVIPSAISLANACPRGPCAFTSTGTAMGRGGAKPSECSIRAAAPSTSTASPRSSAITWRTPPSNARRESIGWPIASRPVKPAPKATASRPGASSASVAMAAACVIGWRRWGTSTPGPSPMRSVRSAIRASVTHTSW